jgi:hypothetical protein
MDYFDEFPDWEKLVAYFESSGSGMVRPRYTVIGRPNIEELLNKETYALYKLLKKM